MFLLLKEKLAVAIAEAASVPLEEAAASIELPKGQFGDVASSICFSLAKKEKKSPVQLASALSSKIKLPAWVSEAKPTGPYINFFLSEKFFSELSAHVLKEKEEFGAGKATAKGKTIVEFPSVNPNKPWHIGHLRNALLGDSVARILSFSGENVECTDYIDDLGLQVAQSYWEFEKHGKEAKGTGKKLDLLLGERYVEASKQFEADEKVKEEVRELLKEMEEGKGKRAKDCRKLVEECVSAQYQTAYKFSIYHDVLIFESDILRTIFDEGMALLKTDKSIKKETAGKNAGCLVAKMTSPEFASLENPDKILVRSDGTATYTGKDVIFQLWKFGLLKNDFTYSPFEKQPNGKECFKSEANGGKKKYGHATRVINVIGMEQAYPQKVIAEILRTMGYSKQAEHSTHLSYEHVGLEDEKFSGRQGTWIGYTVDELYEEGVKRAEEKVRAEVTGAERESIARAVASSAIRFSFIKTTPEKKITFRWDEALSMEGDSAPYVMYAHARAHKILAKAGSGKQHALALSEQERALLKKIMLFDFVISEAARQLRPHILAEYLLDLANSYNKFYNACPILSCEDEKTKENRLAINTVALTTLKNACLALGITPLESM